MIQVMNARVHKIHTAIKFRCSKGLAPWMQWCYDERIRLKKTGQPIEAEAIKLAMNSIYGKLIQNVETFRSAAVHTNIQSWLQALDGHRMTDISVMGTGDEFVGLIHYAGAKTQLQKSPVHMGWRVLELSRLQMLSNHYLGVKKLWPGARLLATDTDGATYQIFTSGDPLRDMALANTQKGRYPLFFDLAKELMEKKGGDLTALSHLPADQLELARQRSGELGAFGLEYFPVWVDEFIGLRAKLYSLRFASPVKDSLRGQAESQESSKEGGSSSRGLPRIHGVAQGAEGRLFPARESPLSERPGPRHEEIPLALQRQS